MRINYPSDAIASENGGYVGTGWSGTMLTVFPLGNTMGFREEID
jgi:hypothetical protein